ncbi:hypothetical protein KY359_01165 [Candidatus Woesearchaeota archaeon]|nr:hypothetical protein [Candidatus Woesearchaeota archaeon]
MKEDIINQFVLWKPVKITSVIIYIVILLVFPFSQFWATIILFGLICFWSRIPCLISMFTKDLEVIDFFTVALALHIGGVFAGMFAATIMLFSRLFGPNEWYMYTIKDAISLFVCGVLTPLIFLFWGNQLYTLYTFTIIRYTLFIILTIILEPQYLMLELGLCAACIFEAFLTNTIMNKFFEGPLNSVLENGVVFNFTLFFFATLVVGFFYLVSRIARWLEVRRLAKVESGEEPEQKPPIWMLDAGTKPMPNFVKTS